MPMLDITYWDQPELGPGWVGGRVDSFPDVVIYANNTVKFATFFRWLMEILREQFSAGRAMGQTQGVFDLNIQGAMINGELNVRFLDWPGVGVRVPKGQAAFEEWMKRVAQVAVDSTIPKI
jgi:hypothetical protein